MAYGGLSSQFGWKQETTVGTAVTVDTFYEILAGTDPSYDINLIEGKGIQAGILSKRDSRTAISTYSASGTLVVTSTAAASGSCSAWLIRSAAT